MRHSARCFGHPKGAMLRLAAGASPEGLIPPGSKATDCSFAQTKTLLGWCQPRHRPSCSSATLPRSKPRRNGCGPHWGASQKERCLDPTNSASSPLQPEAWGHGWLTSPCAYRRHRPQPGSLALSSLQGRCPTRHRPSCSSAPTPARNAVKSFSVPSCCATQASPSATPTNAGTQGWV